MKFSKLLLVALSVSLFVSCSNDDEDNTPKGVYDNGFFVLNEGSSGQGSVSFSSDDFTSFTNDVYSIVNPNDQIGKFVQNIFFDGDKAYIIAGGSNVINVVNRYTFKLIAKIDSGLITPRYGVVKDGKAYVTNANTYSYINPATGDTDDFVAVIDLATNKVESKIDLNATADRVILKDGKLYITDSYGSDKVLIVNIATKALETPVTIGYDAGSIDEKDGVLYILRSPYSGRNELVKVKISDKSVSKIAFPESLDGSAYLDVYNDKIYYAVSKSVYAMNTTATAPSTTPILTAETKNLYGFAVNNDRIFIADASFTANSQAYIYNLNGTILKTLTTGVGSNGFYFNN